MTDVAEPLQIAVAALLVADAGVGAIAGDNIYAEGQAFPDTFPRVTLELPQVIRRDAGCLDASECFVTIHSWAIGAQCGLVASRLAGAVRTAFATALSITGHHVAGQYFESSRPVDDPADTTAHIVSVFRVLTSASA